MTALETSDAEILPIVTHSHLAELPSAASGARWVWSFHSLACMSIAFALVVLGLAIGFDYFLRHRVVVQFGLLTADPERGDIVHASVRRIPFRPDDSGFRFGLRFFMRSGRAFRARIVHVLPRRPSKLEGNHMSGVELPDGRFEVETEEQVHSGGGVRSFRFSQGDPLGLYELHLYINGKLRKVVHYEVVAHAS